MKPFFEKQTFLRSVQTKTNRITGLGVSITDLTMSPENQERFTLFDDEYMGIKNHLQCLNFHSRAV